MIQRVGGAAAGAAVATCAGLVYYGRGVRRSRGGADAGTLLRAHAEAEGIPHHDTVSILVPGRVGVKDLAEAFFNSPAFALERAVLPHSTSDEQAHAFAAGSLQPFALWKNEDRNESEILTTWSAGATRGATWFRVVPEEDDRTRLELGSSMGFTGGSSGWLNTLLLPLVVPAHIAYSKVLLQSAAARLNPRHHDV